jgi:PleD family two-component response regulator
MGVAEWSIGEQIENLIRRADDALYKDKGKISGRRGSESLIEARLA